MGTSDFSCPPLKKLISNSNFEIVAVYTKEPQIAGRGHKLKNSPIHDLALKHGLKVITPRNFKSEESKKEFADLRADVAVVVSYGLILPQDILDSTKFGFANIHPSILPKYRGAAPLQRTIMSGDKETGVAIIKMDAGIDSGDVIIQNKIQLDESENFLTLSEKLSRIGSEILIESLDKIKNQTAILIKQDNALATYAKKIDKSECKINFQESAKNIERKIRALVGSGDAYFEINGEKIKIFSAQIIDKNSTENEVGKILNDEFFIQCGEGIIKPSILQRQGKNKVAIDEFLRGFNIAAISKISF